MKLVRSLSAVLLLLFVATSMTSCFLSCDRCRKKKEARAAALAEPAPTPETLAAPAQY